jgi:hypothetical protein
MRTQESWKVIEAINRRLPERRADLAGAELALRTGSVEVAAERLRRLARSGSAIDSDGGLAVAVGLLTGVIGADGNGAPLALTGLLGRAIEAAERSTTMSEKRAPLGSRIRALRTARVVAPLNDAWSRRVAHRVWRAAYLSGDRALAADALLTTATVRSATSPNRGSALAWRARELYHEAGVPIRAIVAGLLMPRREPAPDRSMSTKLCISAGRDSSLLRAECLIEVLRRHWNQAEYSRAVVVADTVRRRLLAELPPHLRRRFVTIAAPLLEMVGRPADAERLLRPALAVATAGPARAAVALQLAGVMRRSGRPSAAMAVLDLLSPRRVVAQLEVRRLLEMAHALRALGRPDASWQGLVDAASRISRGDADLESAVALASHSLTPVTRATRRRKLLKTPAGARALDRLLARTSPRVADTEGAWKRPAEASTIETGISGATRPLRRDASRRVPDRRLEGDRRGGPAPALDSIRPGQHLEGHLIRGEVVLLFQARAGTLEVTGISAGGARTATIGKDPDRLQALTDLLVASIEEGDSERWRALAARLAEIVAVPLLERGWLEGLRHITVVPDQGVHGLPLDILPHPGRPGAVLGDTIAFSRAASTRLLEAAWHTVARRTPSLVVLPGSAGQSMLEMTTVLEARAGLGLRGHAATETALARRVATSGLLHFGGHAAPVSGAWRSGGLQLRPDRLSDGFLSFEEIEDLRLSGARVVLLGCETGRRGGSASSGGAGAESSLASAFLAAGARSAISTRWRVTDAEGRLIAQAFYGSGGAWRSVEALADANRQLRRLHPDSPRLWAAATWDGAPDRILP